MIATKSDPAGIGNPEQQQIRFAVVPSQEATTAKRICCSQDYSKALLL
jgi:hypothetical protein